MRKERAWRIAPCVHDTLECVTISIKSHEHALEVEQCCLASRHVSLQDMSSCKEQAEIAWQRRCFQSQSCANYQMASGSAHSVSTIATSQNTQLTKARIASLCLLLRTYIPQVRGCNDQSTQLQGSMGEVRDKCIHV